MNFIHNFFFNHFGCFWTAKVGDGKNADETDLTDIHRSFIRYFSAKISQREAFGMFNLRVPVSRG